jgi:hypothetical protein
MQAFSSPEIQGVFNFYKAPVFSISNDLQFWKTFLERIIEEYNKDYRERKVFEFVFNVYDLPHTSMNGYLKSYKEIFN